MTGVPLVTSGFDTPFGHLSVIASPDDGVVRGAGFGPVRNVASQLHSRFGMRGWENGDVPEVSRAVHAWLDGDASLLASVPIEQPGGPFFQEVWATLRTVPSGQVV